MNNSLSCHLSAGNHKYNIFFIPPDHQEVHFMKAKMQVNLIGSL